MDLNLKGKIALVTGGSHGLGEALCFGLAAEGAVVAVNYRQDRALAEAVAAKINERHSGEAFPVVGDMSSESSVIAMFDEVEARCGRVDILVNNAGICPVAQVKDLTVEMWNQTLTVNLTGTFLCCREMIKRLLAKDIKGRIVNVASQAAFRGSATGGKSHYASSKAGIVAFTVALAQEMAPHGICINAVAPGMIKTEMVEEILKTNAERYKKVIPLQRAAEPEEIANVVIFLSSDRASYVTGSTYDVSGGWLLH
ncbi:MAG: 3-oxoacyl-ACP reductase FabG [Candidatus Sumerlaeota bacterium]|nr:3-oxoacyl-ACP reductase FabG [Candidatus Sumerlaeota bacterium]